MEAARLFRVFAGIWLHGHRGNRASLSLGGSGWAHGRHLEDDKCIGQEIRTNGAWEHS